MKKRVTFFNHLIRPFYIGLLVLIGWGNSNAQSSCSLGCNGNIYASVDQNCQVEILPDMLLNASMTTCSLGVFHVELRHNGVLLNPNMAPAIAGSAYIGKTLEAKVIDTRPVASGGGNSCWGWVKVEDKLAPTIDCPTSITDLSCLEASTFDINDYVVDNCDRYVVDEILNVKTVNNCNNGLASNVLESVSKVYIARDPDNPMLVSQPCSITYNVVKLDSLGVINAPNNYLISAKTAISCNANYPKLPNGNPSPAFTGYPTLEDGNGNDINLVPNGDLPCNLLVSYSDDKLKETGCYTKIARTWRILEWSCDAPPARLIVQMIEVADTIKPTISIAKKNYTASTTAHDCEGLVKLDPAVVGDECTEASVIIVGGSSQINGNGGTTKLPVGVHTLYYIVSDKCGNTASDSVSVIVEDLTKPVAVCDETTTVSLTNDGTAWIPASVFDDGSYDECALAKMLVRRMDEECDCETSQFTDFTTLGSYNGHYYYLSKHPIESRLANKHGVALGGYLNINETTSERSWVLDRIKEVKDSIQFLTQNSSNTLTLNNSKTGSSTTSGIAPNDLYNYVVEINEKCGWSSYVKFCCGDVNPTEDVMVAFRVVDRACNFNDCMVSAEVQDKIGPQITCPDDLVFDCDNYFPTGDNVVDFGDYNVIDNCPGVLNRRDVLSGELTQCNSGNFIRTITVTDAGGKRASCTQVITVNGKIYDYDNIIWPGDRNFPECAEPDSSIFSPDNLGRPSFPGEDQCSLLGSDYEDFIYRFNNSNGGACFKIIRRWTVIDWCNLVKTPNGDTYYTYTHDQVIKVSDNTKPEITSSCAPKSSCTYDNQCANGFIELTATAMDACTDVLDFSYRIDAFNNGSFDAGLSGSGKGNMINASGTYPVGEHRIEYTFVDRCGNVTTCDQIFEIINCKAPTPYCLNGLAVDLMPVDTDNDGEIDNGMVELWASDFDAGSFHTCPDYEVLVSFSTDVNDINKTFTCADFGRKNVQLYASVITSRGDTLRAYCNTFVDIQDNMSACDGDDNRFVIEGKILTEENISLTNAKIELQGAEIFTAMSDNDGQYAFAAMPLGSEYEVVPQKNDDAMNGVSTLDLVMIQRHILNLSKFQSPYKYIAADVNKDNKVAASDLVELRKLILGVTSEFSNNKSWRFVDNTEVFPANTNPLNFGFSESYMIDNLTGPMKVDFTSVKVGDVNNSAVTNLRDNSVEPRSVKTLTLSTQAGAFNSGGEVIVPIKAEKASMISGAQFTLTFDATKLAFAAVEAGDMNVTESNFGLTRLADGIITFSWNEATAQSVQSLFAIKFEAISNGNIEQSIDINSTTLSAEAYDENAEIVSVEFRTENAKTGEFVLFQNNPNPFKTTTDISFKLPTSGMVELLVTDVTGKVILNQTAIYPAGVNNITLNKDNHNLSGILYYQVTFNDTSQVKKMVVID